MDSARLVAIGKIKRSLPSNRWEVIAKGDGLYLLALPVLVWLYRPEQSSLSPPLFTTSCNEEGLRQAKILQVGPRKQGHKRVRMKLELTESCTATGELTNFWILTSREKLAAITDTTFLFQLLGRPIFCRGRQVATVKDYFETAANGVIVAAMADGEEVFLPLVDEYVQLDSSAKEIEVERFFEFV